MFDIEGFEPPPSKKPEPPLGKLEIRNFEGVPMSNLPAVLPKTKLIFRPADAFLFDMISFVTLALVLSSVRLDSPSLDLLALVSVSLWTFRTVIRYSNKLARYDLLVKKFLTTKISHRNAGALKYLTSEAGSQRAVRAALVQSWISHLFKLVKSPFQRDGAAEKIITRSVLRNTGTNDVNRLLRTDKEVQVDVDRALRDLEDLRLVRFSADGEELIDAKDQLASSELVKESWVDLLEQSDSDNFGRNDTELSSLSEGIGLSKSSESEPSTRNQNISFKQLEERRKSFTASLEATQKNGYVKAKQLLQDKNGVKNLRASLEGLLEGQKNSKASNVGQRRSEDKKGDF
jgi:hypothetical protein